jgi:hypothetical protein
MPIPTNKSKLEFPLQHNIIYGTVLINKTIKFDLTLAWP